MSEPMVENSADDGASGSSWQERRSLVLVAGGVGALVVGVGAWFLLAGGSGDEGPDLVAKPARTGVVSSPAASPTASSTAAATIVPAELDLDLAKDPFKDLNPPQANDAPVAGASSEPPASDVEPPVNVTSAPVPGGPVVPPTSSTTQTTVVKVLAVQADGNGAVKVKVDGGAAKWVEVGGTVGTIPQVTLASVNEEGVATFYAGEVTGKTVDIEVGDSHTFRSDVSN